VPETHESNEEQSSGLVTRKNAVIALGLGAVACGAVVGLTGSSGRTELQAKLNYIPLQPAGAMGTNRAFIGKADGANCVNIIRVQCLSLPEDVPSGRGCEMPSHAHFDVCVVAHIV
jgi:hypothetical protein